uniref:Uncharacterized protein n=1 Tax=Candidatus Kentrum sp. LFY TaxID=2126342 RepID=A0A450UPF4_9GAMM|nr:MAG: hypothetical protein BECKLFY1418A_GA0070994_10402 [Candidatus Kentron sp. LFY]
MTARMFVVGGAAVAHRDYAIHGSKIRLHLFSDRLEVFSLGALAMSTIFAAAPGHPIRLFPAHFRE